MEVLRALDGRAWSGEGVAARRKPMDAMDEADGGGTPAWEILVWFIAPLGAGRRSPDIWLKFYV